MVCIAHSGLPCSEVTTLWRKLSLLTEQWQLICGHMSFTRCGDVALLPVLTSYHVLSYLLTTLVLPSVKLRQLFPPGFQAFWSAVPHAGPNQLDRARLYCRDMGSWCARGVLCYRQSKADNAREQTYRWHHDPFSCGSCLVFSLPERKFRTWNPLVCQTPCIQWKWGGNVSNKSKVEERKNGPRRTEVTNGSPEVEPRRCLYLGRVGLSQAWSASS